jgi:hypothetical protein
MSAVSLRLPESIHRRIRDLARQEGVSINHLITTALVEKLSALRAEEYLVARASRASPEKFDSVLAKIRDVPPLPFDRLPNGSLGTTPRKRARPRRSIARKRAGGLTRG